MIYIWDGNRVRGSLLTKIADHVLDQDGALSNFAVDRDISALGAL